VSTGLTFRHADGSRYGALIDAGAAGRRTEAFRALRRLGFRESEVRNVLDRLRWSDGREAFSMGRIPREALSTLAH
jgi:hypothetical protein